MRRARLRGPRQPRLLMCSSEGTSSHSAWSLTTSNLVRSGSGPTLGYRAKHGYTTKPRRAECCCPAHFCGAVHTLSEALHRADRTQSRCQSARASPLRGHGGCAGSRPQHRLRQMPVQSVAPSWPRAVRRAHGLSLSLEVSGPHRMTGTAQGIGSDLYLEPLVRAPRTVQHGRG